MGLYFYHYIYGLAAKIYYRLFSKRPVLGDQQSQALAVFRAQGFVVLNDDLGKGSLFARFSPHFDRFRLFCSERSLGYRPKRFVLKRGYSGGQKVQSNQLHMDYADDESCAKIGAALEESGIGDIIREVLGCHYGFCNVRRWRFYPIAKPGDIPVPPHSDNLPANTIKLMVFSGAIGPETGGTELYLDDHETVFFRLSATNPFILIDTTAIIHGAPAPKTPNTRDTIELMIMPQFRAKPIVVSAGFEAHYPYWPWQDWTQPSHWLITK